MNNNKRVNTIEWLTRAIKHDQSEVEKWNLSKKYKLRRICENKIQY